MKNMVNKKDVNKKWMALLIVIVVLSLVVNLLSLNVLYGIAEGYSSSGLEGGLPLIYTRQHSSYNCYTGVDIIDVGSRSDCQISCEMSKVDCKYDACVESEKCLEEGRNSRICDMRYDYAIKLCEAKFKNCENNCRSVDSG